MERSIPSDVVEQWMTHFRRERERALDMIWLIEKGATLHDGRDGTPLEDVTERWLAEQRAVVADVDSLIAAYEGLDA